MNDKLTDPAELNWSQLRDRVEHLEYMLDDAHDVAEGLREELREKDQHIAMLTREIEKSSE